MNKYQVKFPTLDCSQCLSNVASHLLSFLGDMKRYKHRGMFSQLLLSSPFTSALPLNHKCLSIANLSPTITTIASHKTQTMATIKMENRSLSPNLEGSRIPLDRINIILNLHGIHGLSPNEQQLFLALEVLDLESQNIACCATHAKENRGCGAALKQKEGMLNTGLLLISRSAERFLVSDDELRLSLEALLGYFLCATHKNNDNARRNLFIVWYPIFLQYHEAAKGRAGLTDFATLEQRVETYRHALEERIGELESERTELYGSVEQMHGQQQLALPVVQHFQQLYAKYS